MKEVKKLKSAINSVKPDTKVIAMYLPQFHRIPENDSWWGKGFTEWTNVKAAKPLFEGHIQPRVPLNNNYYDLSEPNVLLQQMKMAKEYGVDAFCFYHYWFENGKKLLEKPIENMLNSDKLPLNFCLCWANEPWTRTWDGDLGSKVKLIDQEYGDEESWKQHFNYLEQFFYRDEYLKNNGRPVFVIYRPQHIPCLKEMLNCWNKCAQEKGLEKIFIIYVNSGRVYEQWDESCDGVMDFEPFSTLSNMLEEELREITHKKTGFNGVIYEVYDYEGICKKCVNQFKLPNINHYLGCFPGWDNTPRAKERSDVIKIEGNTTEQFYKYFSAQYSKSKNLGNDYIFINAWNEWGEGAFLEPDELEKMGYLEAIKKTKKGV